MPAFQLEPVAADLNDDGRTFAWVTEAFIVASFLYVALAAENVDDRNFLMYRSYLSVTAQLPLPGGYVDLPGLTYSVSLPEFFLIAPVVVLALHAFGLARISAGPQSDAGAQALAAGVLLGAPLALLAVARSYGPFAAIQPGDGGLLRYWVVLLHVGLVTADCLMLLAFSTRWQGGPVVRAAVGLAGAAAIFALVARGVEFLEWRPAFGDTLAGELGPVLFVAAGIASVALLPAILGSFGYEPVELFGSALDARWVRSAVGPAPKAYLDSLKGRKMPMPMRVTTAAIALVATIQVAHARGIDVAGETLAARMPSESLIAAYVAGEWPGNEQRAWERAVIEQSRGIILDDWRLARANFTGAVMPRVSMQRADLTGAIFDYALLAGADMTEIKARSAKFRYVNFVQVAEGAVADLSKATLTDADFANADLTGTVISKLPTLLSGDQCPDEQEQAEIDKRLGKLVLTGAVLTGTYLEGFDFSTLDSLDGINFDGAKLRCAIFKEKWLGNVAFGAADLTKARFCGARFGQEQTERKCSQATDGAPKRD